MAHELEINEDGQARFAYNSRGGAPWHKLGVGIEGLQDVDTMLRLAGADYTVRLTKVAAVDDDGNLILNPDGTPVIIEDSQATIRQNENGTYKDLATVGTRYEVRQNREVAERALAVVGAAGGDAVVDTCGVLRDGRRFFMTIDLGALIIDPLGVNDKIDRSWLMPELAKMHPVKHIFAFGPESHQFPGATACNTLEEVIQVIGLIMKDGDIVIFSPSGTSFDFFKNYEHRGKVFEQLVQKLA